MLLRCHPPLLHTMHHHTRYTFFTLHQMRHTYTWSPRYKVERYMQWVFIVASAMMAVPVMFHLDSTAEDNTREGQRTYHCCMCWCCSGVGACATARMHLTYECITHMNASHIYLSIWSYLEHSQQPLGGRASYSWWRFVSLRCRWACFGRL